MTILSNEWNQGCFDDGAEARITGYGLDQCPSEETYGSFAADSWRAGWYDADAELLIKNFNTEK